MTGRPLTPRQVDVLFVVGQNQPASVRGVYYHLPHFTEAGARSALCSLENRGLLGRQYTGLSNGVRVAYVLSRDGAEALAALDLENDYDPAEDSRG